MRAPRESDIAALVQLADNRHVAQMLARMPHPYGEAEARAFIAMCQRRAARRHLCADACRHGEPAPSSAAPGSTPRIAGWSSATGSASPTGSAAIATEAAHALVDLAFRATGISVLHVSARVINPASRRVIHKCGFQYAGQGMMNSIVAGQVPIERYRLDRKTWESLRNWS